MRAVCGSLSAVVNIAVLIRIVKCERNLIVDINLFRSRSGTERKHVHIRIFGDYAADVLLRQFDCFKPGSKALVIGIDACIDNCNNHAAAVNAEIPRVAGFNNIVRNRHLCVAGTNDFIAFRGNFEHGHVFNAFNARNRRNARNLVERYACRKAVAEQGEIIFKRDCRSGALNALFNDFVFRCKLFACGGLLFGKSFAENRAAVFEHGIAGKFDNDVNHAFIINFVPFNKGSFGFFRFFAEHAVECCNNRCLGIH